MKIKKGYTQEVIKDNVDELIRSGLNESEALMLAIRYARNVFKKERPDTTKFPEHLIPKQAVTAYREYGGDNDE